MELYRENRQITMLHTFYRSVVQIQVRYFHSLQNDTLVLYSLSVVL